MKKISTKIMELFSPERNDSAGGIISKDKLVKLRGFEGMLRERIIGQPHVLKPWVDTILNGVLGISDPKRPLATFLLLGPTGVGKTEITVTSSQYLFPPTKTHTSIMRFDMSEFQRQESLNYLLGDSSNSEGQMGRKYDLAGAEGFVLFDEIEKAHPLILDIFLQVLDNGRITCANGREIDLTRKVIVGTSNIGAAQLIKLRSSGEAQIRDFIMQKVTAELRPEIVGRFDRVEVFNQLKKEEQRFICQLRVDDTLERLKKQGFYLTAGEEVSDFLAVKGFKLESGAREMRRTVDSYIQKAVREKIMRGENVIKGELVVNRGGNQLDIR